MSATALSETGIPAHSEEGAWQRIREHCAQEWASALLVASIVTIANLHFHWLKAFDTYTFLALGQLTSVSVATVGKQHRAVVVEIDNPTFEKEFEEKTPLNRMRLEKHLEAIYNANPDIVAVDLDVSPMFKATNASGDCTAESGFPTPTAEGEEELYALIKRHATKPEPITTVLLEPYPTDNPTLECWRQNWRASMASPHLAFASGEVLVSYGVHTEISERTDGIIKIVEGYATGNLPAVAPEKTAVASDGEPRRRLDPRQLRKGAQPILLSRQPSAQALTTRLDYELETAAETHPLHKRVVFFGAAYGDDDLFLSAVGDIYGVEAHAAGYVSDGVKDHHVFDFLLDFVIALTFSLAIAFFWRKYFDARLSDNAVTRELAKLWIIALVLSVLCLVIVLSFFSLLFLRSGVWLSPIPIAIGMLFDSFVSGSVDQATHKFKTLRRELIERFTREAAVVGVHVDHSVSVSMNPETQEVTMREVREELIERYTPAEAPPAHPRMRRAPRNHELAFWGARHLPRVLGGDICEHLLAHKEGAAALLSLWTLIWVGTAVFALHLAWTV